MCCEKNNFAEYPMNKYFRKTLPKSHVIKILHEVCPFITCSFLVRNLRKSQHFRHFRRFSEKYDIDFYETFCYKVKTQLFVSTLPALNTAPPPQPTWAEITT
jgi:hypothetical protein